MANYIVPKEILLPHLPHKTELDFYNEKTYVSLVGFMFNDTRIRGIKFPYHINFEEVNLRFYVRYNDNGTWKRGTVFIKEIVPRRAISFIANSIYREKYSTMKMKHFCNESDAVTETCYEWKFKNKWNKIFAESNNKLSPIAVDSEEEFIAEHYWGYSKYNAHTTYEYQVSHPRWKIFKVLNYEIDCDFNGLYGNEFSFLNNINPCSVFVAKGSEVNIHAKKILR